MVLLICKYNELNNTIIMPKNDQYDLLYLKQTGIISPFAKQYFLPFLSNFISIILLYYLKPYAP
jgi:hypothetical protein